MGHRHYERSEGNEFSQGLLVNVKVSNAQLFAPDCKSEGGGGFPEKVGRIQEMINAAGEFRDRVGKLPAVVVRRIIIERAWKAPPIEGATSFTFPASLGASAPAAPATFPDIPRPAADADLLPVNASPNKKCAVELGPHEDERPVFRFKHRLPSGQVYTHTDDQLICFVDMATGLISNIHDERGKCPFCDAKVHPDELKAIKDGSPEQDAMYNEYRTKYNEYNKVGGKRRKPKGGAEVPPLLVRMTNAECALPKKGARRTYRRKQARHKQTRRANTYRRRFSRKLTSKR
jgi:hypothetical protein